MGGGSDFVHMLHRLICVILYLQAPMSEGLKLIVIRNFLFSHLRGYHLAQLQRCDGCVELLGVGGNGSGIRRFREFYEWSPSPIRISSVATLIEATQSLGQLDSQGDTSLACIQTL